MISEFILASALMFGGAAPPPKGEVDAPDYLYMSMNGGPTVGFYNDNPKVLIRDAIVDATNCSTETVVCVEAEGVFIAIPNRATGYASDGTKVEVMKEMDLVFLGTRAHVRLAEATRGTATYRSWYSEKSGLLAFSIAAEGKTATYLLEQPEGLRAGWLSGAQKAPTKHETTR